MHEQTTDAPRPHEFVLHRRGVKIGDVEQFMGYDFRVIAILDVYGSDAYPYTRAAVVRA